MPVPGGRGRSLSRISQTKRRTRPTAGKRAAGGATRSTPHHSRAGHPYRSAAPQPFSGIVGHTGPEERFRRFVAGNPHLLGCLRSLCQQPQPLSNKTRANLLLCLRRLLDDLTANGHCLRPDLILRQDFPPQPQYLPRPLSPPDDLLLQQQLRRTDDLPAHALLLTPPLVWLIEITRPVLDRIAAFINKHQVSMHSGLYERDDLLRLLEQQKLQHDSRIPEEQ